MKLSKCLLSLPSLMLLFFALSVNAQDSKQPEPPPKYRMELVYIFEAKQPEFVFVIGNIGFKSLESLKKFVTIMPPGSILEWAPGCRRMGNEPLLSSEKEMEDFKEFCARSGVKFVLIPAG